MKLATIVPTQMVDFATRTSGYHMLLGQELVRDMDYFRYWRNFGVKQGHFLIVDNGAAEPEEERVPFEQIVDRARELEVDEIVLPDVMRDSEATIIATMKHRHLVPSRMRMVVPQGDSWDEWKYCLYELVDYCDPASIGIAKHLERLPGGRAFACKLIKKRGFHNRHHIHLLGIWRYPYAEPYACAKALPGIRGLDTGAPIAYMQNNAPLNDESPHFSLDWNKQVVVLHPRDTQLYVGFLGDIDWKVRYNEHWTAEEGYRDHNH